MAGIVRDAIDAVIRCGSRYKPALIEKTREPNDAAAICIRTCRSDLHRDVHAGRSQTASAQRGVDDRSPLP